MAVLFPVRQIGTCENCAFFRPFDDGCYGSCHRNPPAYPSLPDKQSAFPIVNEAEFCSGWTPETAVERV